MGRNIRLASRKRRMKGIIKQRERKGQGKDQRKERKKKLRKGKEHRKRGKNNRKV